MAQFTTAEVAAKFETTPRTLRKFLRADAKAQEATDTLPGKGSRYAIEGKALQGMKKRFNTWKAAEAQAKADRAEKAAQAAKVEVEVEVEEVEEVEDLEPTAEDLAAIEDLDD